jgi:hypothetical protein
MSVIHQQYSPNTGHSGAADAQDIAASGDSLIGTSLLTRVVSGQLASYTGAVVSAARQFSELAEKGVSNLLLGLGSVVLLVTLFSKLRLFGTQLSDFGTLEFVAMTLSALLLIFTGTGVRLYQFRESNAAAKDVRLSGRALLEMTTKKALDMAAHEAPAIATGGL